MQPNQFVDADGNKKPNAPEAQNQFTTGKRTKHDQRTKDAIRAELLSQRLQAFVTGQVEDDDENKSVPDLSPAQVAAAKILIDKGKPSLQAVEQQQVNEWDQMSEEQIKDTVRALILSRPELLQELNLQPAMKVIEGQDQAKSA